MCLMLTRLFMLSICSLFARPLPPLSPFIVTLRHTRHLPNLYSPSLVVSSPYSPSLVVFHLPCRGSTLLFLHHCFPTPSSLVHPALLLTAASRPPCRQSTLLISLDHCFMLPLPLVHPPLLLLAASNSFIANPPSSSSSTLPLTLSLSLCQPILLLLIHHRLQHHFAILRQLALILLLYHHHLQPPSSSSPTSRHFSSPFIIAFNSIRRHPPLAAPLVLSYFATSQPLNPAQPTSSSPSNIVALINHPKYC